MQTRWIDSLLLLFLLCIFGRLGREAEAGPANATAPAGEKLASDTPRKMPDGATFVAPGGWWIEARGNAIILTPEGDTRRNYVPSEEIIVADSSPLKTKMRCGRVRSINSELLAELPEEAMGLIFLGGSYNGVVFTRYYHIRQIGLSRCVTHSTSIFSRVKISCIEIRGGSRGPSPHRA